VIRAQNRQSHYYPSIYPSFIKFFGFAVLITALSACGGGGGGSGDTTSGNDLASKSSLVAVSDEVGTQQDTRVKVDVLANDRGFSDGIPTISIVSHPGNGGVAIGADGTITYTPKNGFTGTDTFIYRISDAAGGAALATATVQVACSGCSNSGGNSVTLTWDPVPGAVLGYLVSFAEGLVRDPASATTVISKNTVTLDARADLGLAPGDYACFWVQSVNRAGISALSEPACGVI
jgi:hypothetical protein